jgi:short subunit dehydrogenase-like uncharacterized protein
MSSDDREWMIYGATGYTGMLIAERAAEQGLKPVLAGRDDVKVRAIAGRLGLPWRVFALDGTRAARDGVAAMALVLHCAGPFSATSRPMLDACLAGHAHYLDITGEIDVFEACYARDSEARARGIVAMPGVGFDVVPTDCLARLLAQRLPSATKLELGIAALGKISQGTAKSAIEGLPRGTLARRGGRITKIAPLVREIDFDGTVRRAMATSWGDVASAYRTTGIPEITVYMAFPPAVITTARVMNRALPALGLAPVQRALRSLIERRVSPPTAEDRAHGRSLVWGRVEDETHRSVEGLLRCAEGYDFTVASSLAIAQKVLTGAVPHGATTPARALGGDFVRSLPDVTVTLPGA